MSKLTLHVPEELVLAAKNEAAARKVSVSKLVSDYFSTLATNKAIAVSTNTALAPRTSRLAGCLPSSDRELDDYIGYLERKHS